LEVAKKLKQSGETVNLVSMFDTWAPGFIHSKRFIDRFKKHRENIRELGTTYIAEKFKQRGTTIVGASLKITRQT
jgi:thioesterase domain-containing protein